MRVTQLFVLAAAAGVASQASAQETRVRSIGPQVFSYSTGEAEHRAALGITTGLSGTARDTLGLLVQSVTRGSPAEKAGLEEGNRIAAINSVNLRAAKEDLEDNDMSSALVRRLTRELGRLKPGDEVDLRVYRDGRYQNIKVKTADSDSLFRVTTASRVMRTSEELRKERENRPSLGISVGSTGSKRDTLGVLVMGVADSSPDLKAGIEEGNRIAAINGVNLRVAREDAGDRSLSSTKAQRYQRELAQLKPGDNVTLSVYANGRTRDVTMKVARAADLPRGGGFTIFGGDGYAPMPLMPSMPDLPARILRAPGAMELRLDPEARANIERARVRLQEMRPQLERSLRTLEPSLRMELDRIRPELQRVRVLPRVRVDIDA